MPAPPNLAVGDYLKLTAVAFCDAQVGQVSGHFKVTAVAGLSLSVQDVVDSFVISSDGQWPLLLCASARADDARLELYATATGRVLQSAIGFSSGAVGTIAGNTSPKQDCVIVRKHSGFAGPRNRGRVFFPFVPQLFIGASGDLALGAGAPYLVAYDVLFGASVYGAAGNTATLTPVILHRPPAVPLPLSSVDVTSRVLTDKIATQRRRGSFGKPNNP